MKVLQTLLGNGIIVGSAYALMAIGFAFIYRTVRFFHFAHGVVYTVGAYAVYSLALQAGLNVVVAFFLGWRWRRLLGLRLTAWSIAHCGGRKPEISFS